MNSDISHDSSCVYYDFELKKLTSLFRDVNKILRNIEKRAERRQTVQLSSSLFDYVERCRHLDLVPQDFYDFRCGDYRVCIYRYKKKFSVLCVGFEYFNRYFLRKDYSSLGSLYFEFDTLKEVIPYFYSVVFYFLDSVLKINALPLL
ncbi:MAG: hypothetical protein [Microviridae sp.]|nr:MAG: hypothetical protein [Microviridae sp.]